MSHHTVSIVVGYDGTPAAEAALHWAAAEARSRSAHLRVVVAWDPSPVTPWNLPQLSEWRAQAETDARAAAHSAREAVGGGLDVEALAIEGAPGAVLAAESQTAELLVVGSAGHVGLAGLLAGSVSRHLLHRSACPLVVLGPHAHSDPTRRLVLSPTLDPDGETFDWVSRWVARRPVPVHVVASFDITADIADLALAGWSGDVRVAVGEQTDAWMARLRTAISSSDTRSETGTDTAAEVTSIVVEGPAQRVLADQTQPGDLLVVPAGCEHGVPVAHGTCPIAVVPPQRRERVVAMATQRSAARVSPSAAGVR